MAKEEIVGIFNSEFEQLFLDAVIMSAEVTEDSRVMTHPLEDGSEVSDHQVFNLISISMPVILSNDNYVNAYKEIEKSYKENELFTIQTKVSVYKNMILNSKPYSQNKDGGVRMTLSFTQFNTATTAVKFKPKNPPDSNTKKRGVQNGKPVHKDSIFKGLYS
jgi:hypothetical protein